MSKSEYLIMPKGAKFMGLGKLGLNGLDALLKDLASGWNGAFSQNTKLK